MLHGINLRQASYFQFSTSFDLAVTSSGRKLILREIAKLQNSYVVTSADLFGSPLVCIYAVMAALYHCHSYLRRYANRQHKTYLRTASPSLTL